MMMDCEKLNKHQPELKKTKQKIFCDFATQTNR